MLLEASRKLEMRIFSTGEERCSTVAMSYPRRQFRIGGIDEIGASAWDRNTTSNQSNGHIQNHRYERLRRPITGNEHPVVAFSGTVSTNQ